MSVLWAPLGSFMLCTSLSASVCTDYHTQLLRMCCAGSRLPPQAAARSALPTAPIGEVIDYYELLGVRCPFLHCTLNIHITQEDLPHALGGMSHALVGSSRSADHCRCVAARLRLLLGQVDDDASLETVKTAYRQLAKHCHPDYLGGEGHDACVMLNEARLHSTLSCCA